MEVKGHKVTEYSSEQYFNEWGILELLGDVRIVGFVTEEERFGGKVGRLVPINNLGQYLRGGPGYYEHADIQKRKGTRKMIDRREVSLGILRTVGSIVLRDSTLHKVAKYHRTATLYDLPFMPYDLEFNVIQQRPYTTAYLTITNGLWAVGYSKCIGKVGDRPQDEWDAIEGARLALARAASDIADIIVQYEEDLEE